MSLDKVSKLTGVSRSMLGQIERGESNPTISVVWKIANGMKVSFTELINQQKPDSYVIKEEEIQSITENDGTYVAYPYFPYEEGRKFEVYKVDIEEGGHLDAEAHLSNTYEFVIVFEGQLTIKVNDDVFVINAGDAIKFKADKEHSYINSGKGSVKMSMTIHYDN